MNLSIGSMSQHQVHEVYGKVPWYLVRITSIDLVVGTRVSVRTCPTVIDFKTKSVGKYGWIGSRYLKHRRVGGLSVLSHIFSLTLDSSVTNY